MELFPEADHRIRVGGGTGFAPGYLAALDRWIGSHSTPAHRRGAGAATADPVHARPARTRRPARVCRAMLWCMTDRRVTEQPAPHLPEFAERVLDVVERIPRGRVMSYGDIAEFLGSRAPRAVGQALYRHGDGVPWHRVLRSDGTPAPQLRARQLALLRAEGVPLHGGRVDMARARWDGG